MRAVVLAYHNLGCRGLACLVEHGFEIAAVFTHKDQPGENIWFDSVARTAARMDIPVNAPDDINHPIWVEKIRGLQPDIIFSFYYRQLIKKPILAIPPAGCLNLHGSLLPKYRGRCPINWAIINGETETGVTLHYMTPRPDDGDVVGQERFPIGPSDTPRELFAEAETAAIRLLNRLLPLVTTGHLKRLPQDEEQATYFGGRCPSDGEIDWQRDAATVHNLVRGVSEPYPGAFSYISNRKVYFWETDIRQGGEDAVPGTILSIDPLVIACGRGALQVATGQVKAGTPQNGRQLATDLGLEIGACFGPRRLARSMRKRKVLILGVNGFIGNHLSQRLLEHGGFEIYGMDLHSNSLDRLMAHPDFYFFEGDITINREWIEYHVRKCDLVLPLVAIATPSEYTRNPLRVFELDFEENLRIIRHCVTYRKRVIFPSTSEVYGMCADTAFDEERSQLVLGPINKQRWIYSCSKQLLDRVIWAYGQQQDLRFTLFRPFNWIGPRLDSLQSARIGSSRVITQLILNLVDGTPIKLVDGGSQRRCFTDVADGTACLEKIIINDGGHCDSRIFNIGNPNNDYSIAELARMLVAAFREHPSRDQFPPFAGMEDVEAFRLYGEGYEDIQYRRPRIRNARKLLGWRPLVPMQESINKTLDFFLKQAIEARLVHEHWPAS